MLGNQALFTEFDMELGDLVQRAEALRQEGQTVMFVAVDGQPAGLLGIADPIKTSTPEAIPGLHVRGVQMVMLTGDSRTTAEAVPVRWASSMSRPKSCPSRKGTWSGVSRARAMSSPWRGTASTTPRPWRRRTSALLWVPARTWRWRALV